MTCPLLEHELVGKLDRPSLLCGSCWQRPAQGKERRQAEPVADLGEKKRRHISILLVGIVKQVLQRTLDTVKESVKYKIIQVLDVVGPEFRIIGLKQLSVLLDESVDLLSSSTDNIIAIVASRS